MKLKYIFGLGVLALVAFFLLAAAPPAPVWRNAWTTNAGAGPVHGASNLQITNDNDLIWNFFSGGTSTVARIADVNTATGNVANLFILNQSGSGSNLTLKSSATTTAPLVIQGIAGGTTNQFEIKDSVGNVVAYANSNGVYRTTNDFYATFTSINNTTNTVYSFVPLANSVVRISVNVAGYNATNSCSFGKFACYRNVAGVVTAIGANSSLASFSDLAVDTALITLSGSTVSIQVAGSGTTMNWVAAGSLLYSQ